MAKIVEVKNEGGDSLEATVSKSKADVEQSVKEYLNKNDRFATRMKASLKRHDPNEVDD